MIRMPSSYVRGFSLLEVLVALVVISIGVLGIAAIQATALSSTHTSQTESIVAIQARSMADAMEANTAYWASGTVPAAINVAPTSSTAATLTPAIAVGTCNTSACGASEMAAYDLNQWGGQLFSQVPGSTALISCSGAPVACTIKVTWTQKATTAINDGTASNPASATSVSYTLVNQL